MVKPAPTLDDVAKMAGVSTATVSRCLNEPGKVIETTRDKVMKAVDALGYTPNFAARVMAAKRSFTIGAIVPTLDNAIFAKGLQAFQEALHSRGYTLLVSSSAYKPVVEKEQIRTLVARGADGLLLIGYEREDQIYTYLAQQNVPALVAWAFDANGPVPSVGFDNHAAMYAMATEAIDRGHRRLAMISGACTGNDRAQRRLDGVKDAMAARGLSPDALAVIETAYTIEAGEAAFARLMARTPRATAVICGNDLLAVGALQTAKSLGLDVPGDVSLTGFDDMELARIVHPTLTTVAVPHREMGQTAADELIAMVEGSSPGRSRLLETRLVLRASLA
ncbi:LacI family DNA-binding transcriptional regulator [Roseovarius phycicola]|uniref:LacI family DNA-binding transcriptional regulator n=1 Tax=Roseovarius phycicola TaxID=3080976 RepID=A0ABZ2HQT1_9RHOB